MIWGRYENTIFIIPGKSKQKTIIIREKINFTEKMSDVTILLVHGRNKLNVPISTMSPLRDLMIKVEEITGIPQKGQKLICQGQTLTAQDPDKTPLHTFKLNGSSKVMVLGRKIDPQQDQDYQKIVAIEKRTLEISEKFHEVTFF